jgi:GTPase
MNLTEDQVVIAYETLAKVAITLECDCSLIHKKKALHGGWVAIVMMRKRVETGVSLEIRVACMLSCLDGTHYLGVGNVDAGKSTLLGIHLTSLAKYRCPDQGRVG